MSADLYEEAELTPEAYRGLVRSVLDQPRSPGLAIVDEGSTEVGGLDWTSTPAGRPWWRPRS